MSNNRKSSWKKIGVDSMKELIEEAWIKNKDKILNKSRDWMKKVSPRPDNDIDQILIMNYTSNTKVNGTTRSPWWKYVK